MLVARSCPQVVTARQGCCFRELDFRGYEGNSGNPGAGCDLMQLRFRLCGTAE